MIIIINFQLRHVSECLPLYYNAYIIHSLFSPQSLRLGCLPLLRGPLKLRLPPANPPNMLPAAAAFVLKGSRPADCSQKPPSSQLLVVATPFSKSSARVFVLPCWGIVGCCWVYFTGFSQCFVSAPLRSKTMSGSFGGAFGAERSSCCLRVNLQVTIPSTFIWNSPRRPLLRPTTSAFMQKHFKSDHRHQRRLPNEAARHCSSSLLSAERRGSMLINEPRSGTQQEWAAIICSTVCCWEFLNGGVREGNQR